MKNKPLPPIYLFSAIILIVIFNFLFPVIRFLMFPWNLAGIIILVIGGALNMSADSAFKKHETTVKPFEESSALVTGGVFRISRNPMYLGMVFILLGISVLAGSLTPFFIVLIYAIVMDRVFISVEEKMLAEKFGGTWLEHRGRVRRWI